jgi:hypothetical protein
MPMAFSASGSGFARIAALSASSFEAAFHVEAVVGIADGGIERRQLLGGCDDPRRDCAEKRIE